MRVLKKAVSFMFSRLFLVALMLAAQLLFIVFTVVYFSQAAFYAYLAFNIISFVAVIWVISNDENPSYKITWIVAILFFPMTGGIFYLMLGNKRMPRALRKQVSEVLPFTRRHMSGNDLCREMLLPGHPDLALQSQYIYNTSGFPVEGHTAAEYYPVGELMYESLLRELQKAERFIFLEYFIIRKGLMWDTIFDLLKEKIRLGVEVRLMYDDLGCISTLPQGYDRIIREAGIRLCVFNPFRPRVNVLLNYRDHRKICVIDGHTAFCGGINLADEYINQLDRFGHWKDTGVMLRGEAVWSFTFMFLQQWEFASGEGVNYQAYKGFNHPEKGDGLIQVFGDSPLDKFNVTETAYLNIITRATRYVYITTPYLVIDYEMENALCAAAQSGIDVRIVTPYRYDKWYVHMLTRSHYRRLIRAGVRIYEYTPGFMHGKMFVSDDQVCMVGTCNMDFRSFYLHFECSVAFFNADLLYKVKNDMLQTQQVSKRISLKDTRQISLLARVLRACLKVFAPLM